MNRSRAQIESVFRAAVAAVDPRQAVRDALATDAALGTIGGRHEASPGHFYLIAIGKASAAMAAGAIDALGDDLVAGIVVSKEPVSDGFDNLNYLVGSHPVPDSRSLLAGEAVLDFAMHLPEDAQVLCLISGGGSALVEALREDFDLSDLQAVTRQLLSAGAPIEEINAVRSQLSRIKAGGLLSALGTRPVTNLIISDVLGDQLQSIASGPTVAPPLSTAAGELVDRYGLRIELPAIELNVATAPVRTDVIANLPKALVAAAMEAVRLGYRPRVLTDRLEGEAREAGGFIAQLLTYSNDERSPLTSGDCVLLGGETTVTIRGNGTGGRNSEAALAAAIALRGVSGVTVGFLATDGDDGLTGAAGAIVDGATITSEENNRARQALEDNDSYGFLSTTGSVWAPGATGTNVNDLVIALIE